MSDKADDPIARLWVTALRAQLDALVTQFEAQLKQHVAQTAGARQREIDALAHELATAAARLKESEQRARSVADLLKAREQEVGRLRAELEARHGEVATLTGELERARAENAKLVAEGAARRDEVRRLESSLAALGQQVQTLDEQFVAERAFVAALLPVTGTLLFDAAQLALGQSIEAAPGCYGALKARKPDALLALVVRERGRTVGRHSLTAPERASLAALAEASGCELIEVPAGARFVSATMEKAATRSDPSEEDHVLECLMPGLRLAGTQGGLVHPRVLVATA
jgi:hypothetical protein